MKIYEMDDASFEEFKNRAVQIADIGNYWWRKGYPAIAEKLMEANLMMLKELVPPSEEDAEAKLGLQKLLERIRREMGKSNEEATKTTH